MKMQPIKLNLNIKKTRLPFTPEEKEKYYNEVKKSAHVFKNRKAYSRKDKYVNKVEY